MKFNILTLFPELFPGPLAVSIPGKARDQGLWDMQAVQIRNFACDNYRSVDDTPFGGGPGMVMRADILEAAFLSVRNPGRRLYMSPRGRRLDQNLVLELTKNPQREITLLCGRYEGVDQRFLDHYAFEEISVGDYVLAGGETAALCLMESCIRLLPGAMGNALTCDEESFSNGLLEYSHYTRPALWKTHNGEEISVPEILTSGNHAKIRQWRSQKSSEITARNRPDLIKNLDRT